VSRLRIGRGRSSVLLIERLSVGALWVAPEKLGPGRLMSDEQLLQALEAGPCQRFSDWPNQSVPKVAAGVYTVWEDGRLIYVGMSVRALTFEDIDAPDEPAKPKGSMDAAVRLRRSCCNPSRTLTTLTVHSCAAIEEQGRFVQLSASERAVPALQVRCGRLGIGADPSVAQPLLHGPSRKHLSVTLAFQRSR
jgi:hypothetical protein